MKELYRTENDLVVYLQESGRIAIYKNGNYYYQSRYDHNIEDIERHNNTKLDLTKYERYVINYIICNINRNELIENINRLYNWNKEKQFKVKKDDFHDYQVEVLLENDFANYYCYEDETNYKYIIIEKKEVE